jgi:hypothetical protein
MFGKPQMARDDLSQLLRNLSTADKLVKVKELVETGNYRSRTGRLAVGGLDPNAAAAVLFGATPAPVQNYYDYNEMVYEANAANKELIKRLREKANIATTLLTEGDKDDILRGTKLWNEVSDELWASNMSNTLKGQTQRSLVNVSVIPDIMRNALRLGTLYDAQLLQQQTQ